MESGVDGKTKRRLEAVVYGYTILLELLRDDVDWVRADGDEAGRRIWDKWDERLFPVEQLKGSGSMMGVEEDRVECKYELFIAVPLYN